MRICIISDNFPPIIGGIGVFTVGLAKHLAEDERVGKVSIVTFNREISGREVINRKLEIIRLKVKSENALLHFMEKGVKLMYHLLRKRNYYDVFHATTIYPSGFFVSIFNKFFIHKKSFVTVYGRDILRGFKNKAVRYIIRKTFDATSKIIFFSNSTREMVKELYTFDEGKTRVIYPGVSPPEVNQKKVEALRRKYRIDETDFIVLFLGRLATRKGVDDLIHAVHNLQMEGVKLVVAGDGPEREELMKLRGELDLEEKVIFTGRIPVAAPIYKLADIFCSPSKYRRDEGDIEGLGLVFIEAQSCGIPVIGTDSGGIPETIDDDKSGFVVPEGDSEAIRGKIVELKNNKYLHNEMSEHAIKFVSEKFSWERCVEAHIGIYSG